MLVTRKSTNLGLATLASLSALVGTMVAVVPSPATAANPCVASRYTDYSADYARTTNVSGTCTRIGVRHYYSPQASSNFYWTSWVYGVNSAQSPRQAELSKAEFYAA